MKRWLLTLPILLAGMAGVVQADYFLIVVNTGNPSMVNAADFVGVIVETDHQPLDTKNMIDKLGNPNQGLPVKYRQYNLKLARQSSISFVFLFTEKSGTNPMDRARPNVSRMFDLKRDDKKIKTPPLELAEWALTHGLLDKYVETMDKLALDEQEKANPAVANYVKLKPTLDAKLELDPDSEWLKRLKIAGFVSMFSKHYVVVHNVPDKYKADVQSRLDRLEESFRTFYYWHALRGNILPVPRERLVVVLAGKEDDENLRDFRTITDGGEGRLAGRREDGFFARREGIVYLNLSSREPSFEKLNAFAENKLGKLPTPLVVENVLIMKQTAASPPDQPNYWVMSLAVKALEVDAERATISHLAARQLAWAAGLLPRYVASPEWLQYGLGSFFETPLGSPWASPTLPNSLHLKPCVDILKPDANVGDILKQVVTDGFFRESANAKDADQASATLARARCLSWGLTYFLAQKKPEMLQRYYAELNKMPRDLSLDADSLLACFARAVNVVDTNNKVDDVRWVKLAEEWRGYVREAPNEAAPLITVLQENINRYQKSLMP